MKRLFILLLVTSLLSSCALTDFMFSNESFDISVDSYSVKKYLPKEYYLMTSNKDLDPFLKSEIENYIEMILIEKGLTRVDSFKYKTYAIVYNIEIEQVDKIVTGRYPITGVTGSNTTTSLNGSLFGSNYGNNVYANGTINSNENTTYNRGIVGWGSYQKPVTYYAKRMIFVAGTRVEDNPHAIPFWKMNVGTWDGDNDLRTAIPYMLSGFSEYYNINTKGIKTKETYPSNRIVRMLRR